MKILITGSAGFIGFHAAERFANEGYEVVGIDNLNDYYDPTLKLARLEESGFNKKQIEERKSVLYQSLKYPKYYFRRMDIADKLDILELFEKEKFDYVLHLAAQAGVRYSLINPDAYIQSNMIGFYNVLEACKNIPVKHLVYASSSSVYGNSTSIPFKEKDMTDETVSLYAATKKSNELFAYNYSYLFSIPTTGLRFFTVYGPWGRPDMAYFSFANKIVQGTEIELFNGGDMYRDFTYIDDIIESLFRIMNLPPNGEKLKVPQRILNIGNARPVNMKEFIKILEMKIGKRAKIIEKPMQETDMLKTYADISVLENLSGYRPRVQIEEGLSIFMEWFKNHSNSSH